MLTSGRSVNGGLGRLDRCLSSPTRHGGLDDLHDDDDDDDDNYDDDDDDYDDNDNCDDDDEEDLQ